MPGFVGDFLIVCYDKAASKKGVHFVDWDTTTSLSGVTNGTVICLDR